MSILNKIRAHYKDEHSAVEDALEVQKLRVSCERRIYNFEKLIHEEVPESAEKHKALASLHNFRIAVEAMLSAMDDTYTAELKSD